MKQGDQIKISGLRIWSKVGVPDEERENAQELSVDLIICPQRPLRALSDDITQTIDYGQVAVEVRRIAGEGSRKLIETLAEDIAKMVLAFNGISEIRVEVKKFILPDTDYVSVTLGLNREVMGMFD